MRTFVAAACCLAVSSVAWAQKPSAQVQPFVKVGTPLVALTHVRLIDGAGAAARDDQTLVLANGKIQSVSAAASAEIPKEAQALDLHGYSVIRVWSACMTTCFIPWAVESLARWPSAFPVCISPAG